MPSLGEVFGMSADPRYAYVDRGTLDSAFAAHLESTVHVVVHGGSKQGKTWLRDKALGSDAVSVQCQPTSTVASLMQEILGLLGVRATLREASGSNLGGEIDLSASGEMGVFLLAKSKVSAALKGKAEFTKSTESAPIGRAPGDLAWVAFCIREIGRRVILEDFHYLPAAVQQEFAFLLRGLHGYGVYFVIVGVWAQGDLLTYYNGELEWRVEDVHLKWTDEELREVIDQGSRHLNIKISEEIVDKLVEDARGSIGLLQRSVATLCKGAGVEKRSIGARRYIDDSALVHTVRSETATHMAVRFSTFATRFTGISALHRDVLRAVVTQSDAKLLSGISLDELPGLIKEAGGQPRSKPKLLDALASISDTQGTLSIFPPVLAWDLTTNRLFVVDLAFLYYRAFASPIWPWDI